ncbi:hypothetical protein HDU76_003130 [Blyttiomyces sp. JEL0837]|nr:hypothetical protein HDU76_003130 [Blyttiomyces sp. JEL0837]
MIDDVLGVVDFLSWQTFHLLGHSTGGHIAACFAGLFPERVTSLVMLNSLGTFIQFAADDVTEMKAFVLRRREVNQAVEESLATDPSRPPTRIYSSFDEAVMARTIGFTHVSPEAASILCKRGLRFLDEDQKMEEDDAVVGGEDVKAKEEMVIDDVKRDAESTTTPSPGSEVPRPSVLLKTRSTGPGSLQQQQQQQQSEIGSQQHRSGSVVPSVDGQPSPPGEMDVTTTAEQSAPVQAQAQTSIAPSSTAVAATSTSAMATTTTSATTTPAVVATSSMKAIHAAITAATMLACNPTPLSSPVMKKEVVSYAMDGYPFPISSATSSSSSSSSTDVRRAAITQSHSIAVQQQQQQASSVPEIKFLATPELKPTEYPSTSSSGTTTMTMLPEGEFKHPLAPSHLHQNPTPLATPTNNPAHLPTTTTSTSPIPSTIPAPIPAPITTTTTTTTTPQQPKKESYTSACPALIPTTQNQLSHPKPTCKSKIPGSGRVCWRTDPRLTLWAYLHCPESTLLNLFKKITAKTLVVVASRSELFANVGNHMNTHNTTDDGTGSGVGTEASNASLSVSLAQQSIQRRWKPRVQALIGRLKTIETGVGAGGRELVLLGWLGAGAQKDGGEKKESVGVKRSVAEVVGEEDGGDGKRFKV